jgi:hypothetical protein
MRESNFKNVFNETWTHLLHLFFQPIVIIQWKVLFILRFALPFPFAAEAGVVSVVLNC